MNLNLQIQKQPMPLTFLVMSSYILPTYFCIISHEKWSWPKYSMCFSNKMCSSLYRACNLNFYHHRQRFFYALIGYKLLQITFKLEVHWRSLIHLAPSKLLVVRYDGFPLSPPTHFPSLLKIASSLNHYHCNYNKKNQ